jgi:hypothetical protein
LNASSSSSVDSLAMMVLPWLLRDVVGSVPNSC